MKLAEKLRAALKLPCVGKVRYDGYRQAACIARLRTQPGAKNRASFVQPYACPHCAGFHLTSKPHRGTLDVYPVIGAWPT